MFQGIKLLKLHGWEKLHCESINKVRSKELWETLKVNVLMAVSGEQPKCLTFTQVNTIMNDL